MPVVWCLKQKDFSCHDRRRESEHTLCDPAGQKMRDERGNEDGWNWNNKWDNLLLRTARVVTEALLAGAMNRDGIGMVLEYLLQSRPTTQSLLRDEATNNLVDPFSHLIHADRNKSEPDCSQRLLGQYVLLRLTDHLGDSPFEVLNVCTGLQFRTEHWTGFPFEPPDPRICNGCGECQLLTLLADGRHTLVRSSSDRYYTEHTCRRETYVPSHFSKWYTYPRPIQSGASLLTPFQCNDFMCHLFSLRESGQQSDTLIVTFWPPTTPTLSETFRFQMKEPSFALIAFRFVCGVVFVASTRAIYVLSSDLKPRTLLKYI